MASRPCKTCLANFLEKIGLERYTQRLTSQGYENAFDICLLDEKDLDRLRVLDSTDRWKILEAGKVLVPNTSNLV